MKKILLISSVLLFSPALLLNAQENQTGSVIFEEVAKIEIKLEGEMAHLMKDMPKERRSNKILYFSPEASVYKSEEKEEKAAAMGHEGGMVGMRIMMSEPDNILHFDLVNKEMVEQREFMTRMFLIKGDMPKSDWKVTGEQKMILDYPCMEATRTDTAGIMTRVWFAPGIPLQTGPSEYCNLPGLVLEVDIDNGEQQFLATAISFETPDKNLLKKPKEGKKVTKEEFDKVVEEKMKEMGAEGAVGGTQVMIRIKH